MRTDRPDARSDLVVSEISEMLSQYFDKWQVRRHALDVIRTAPEDAPSLGRSSPRDLGE